VASGKGAREGCRRVGHGLDSSTDWIGLDWIGSFCVIHFVDWIGLGPMEKNRPNRVAS